LQGTADEQRADVAEAPRSDCSERQKEGEPDRRGDGHVTAQVDVTAPGKNHERDERQREQLGNSSDAQGHKGEQLVPA